MKGIINKDGFNWKPLVTKDNGLICALDILMLREGAPSNTIHDIDNRLKTIFDALTMPTGAQQLGEDTPEGKQKPDSDEDPFYVLLEDDKFITHLAVTSDMLLEPVDGRYTNESVRLVVSVTIRPYNVTQDNLEFS